MKGFPTITSLVLVACTTTSAFAAECSDTASGFDAWKAAFASEARANGIGDAGLIALASTAYAKKTIAADRNQKSFKLSFNEFMAKRGGPAIVAKGKRLKAKNAELFARIEREYGVPAGPLLAIWGMETGFGGFLGDQNTLSAVATLAFDCRRTAFFSEQLVAALALVDLGVIEGKSIGAMHGEIGQTQFLPLNVLKYGVDSNGDGRIDLVGSSADALASTANFLKGHGWTPGAGYQVDQPNFVALEGWNAAEVYQKAIAAMGAEIDGE